MANLPYVTAPGNVEKALEAIKTAATPPRVSQDFVKTVLNIRGGSGNQVTAFLKKIGFAAGDGSPSELYRKFRNPDTCGQAAVDALRIGYKPLFDRNEYTNKLTDEKLRGLIIEVTGQGQDSTVVGLILKCIRAVNKFAVSASSGSDASQAMVPARSLDETKEGEINGGRGGADARLGLNLAYTINLNLPATSDAAVFNAIFKSLKENLLKA